MKKVLLLVVLVGGMVMLHAQKLEKTSLKFDVSYFFYGNIDGFGSDENNYYLYYGTKNFTQKGEDSYYVINKKNAAVKRYVIVKNKNERFLKATLHADDVIILIVRDQKREQKTQIVKQAYAKTTGKLRQETVIASFPKSKSENFLFRSTMSPDKTKIGFLFMIANKKNTVDGYYVAVLNEACNVEWNSVNDLELSNESFSLKNLALTNKGELYIAFFSSPGNVKQAVNKKSYIDLVYLTEETKEKIKMPLEKHELADVFLKPLKNGEVYMAAVLTANKDSYADEFFSLKLNGSNFNDGGSHTKEIVEKNTHAKFPATYFLQGDFLYSLKIDNILELDNGSIAVVCEQEARAYQTSYEGISYCYVAKGAVSTFFVNGKDASIENVSVINRFQTTSIRNYDVKASSASIYSFAYGNKVAYLSNDEFTKHVTSAKKIKNDRCIILTTQESGENAKTEVLTGKQAPSDALLRQILFQENGKLIVLTKDYKTGYIETLSLP